MNATGGAIHVLHVDDEPALADTAATFLERESDRFSVETATDATEGLKALSSGEFDCVVSDYDMPGRNGIEFLEAVREDRPDLPFVLYTGKGSEEVASEAISAGVTEYLQKESGTGQYAVLANRIRNAVEKRRAQSELSTSRKRLDLFFEQSPFGVIRWDDSFQVARVNEAAEKILGYDEETLVGESWEAIVPESDREDVDEVVTALLEDRGGYHSVNENVRADGERIVCEWHNRVVTDEDDEVLAVFSQFRDVTERRRRERRFEAIFNNTYTFTGLLDPEGRVLEVNDTALSFVDSDREAVVGSPIWETDWVESIEASRETVREAVERARNGELYRDEIRVEGSDREAVIDFTVRPVTDERGEVVLLVPEGRDITERRRHVRRLETLVDNLPGMVYRCRNERGWSMSDVRGEAESLTGYTADEIERRDDFYGEEVVHPEDREAVWTAVQEAVESGDPFELTYRIQTADGERRWVWERGRGVSSDGDEVTALEGFVTDVTERRQKTEQLERERRFVDQALDALDDVFYVVGPDGGVRRWNERLSAVTGHGDEEIADMQAVEFFPEDEREAVAAAIEEARATGRSTVEADVRTADGDRVPYEFTGARLTDADGEFTGIVGVGRDVSDRKAREREFRQSEQRYRNLVEDAPVPVNLFDETGTVVWGNDAVLDLLGLESREELVGQSVFEFIHPEDRSEAESELDSVVRSGESVGPTTFRIVREDGDVRHVQVKTTAGWWEDDRVGQAVAVDVTHRRRYEEMLTALHERTREMTRTDDRADIAGIAVETVADLLDADGAALYDFTGQADLALLAESAGFDAPAAPPTDDGALWNAFVAGETRVWRESEVADPFFPETGLGSALVVPVGNHGVLVVGWTADRDPGTARCRVASLVTENLEATLDRANRERGLRERDEELRRQNRALEQLNRLNGLIREINRTLLRASDPAAVDREVCERFADADRYAFAWIAGHEADGSLLPRERVGVNAEFVQQVPTTESNRPLRDLVDAAFEEESIQVAQSVLEDADWERHRSEAIGYGYRSVAAVPVVCEGHVERVLVIHAVEPDIFDERERAVLEELGHAVGDALVTTRRVRALQHDESVEIRVEIGDDRLFTNRLPGEVESDVESIEAVDGTGETLRAFLRLRDPTGEECDALQSLEVVESVRRLSVDEESVLLQVEVSPPSLVDICRDYDAVLASVEVGAVTSVEVSLPGDVGVRSFVEELQTVYDDARLAARQEGRPEPTGGRSALGEDVLADLTDRQREALGVAHHGGFYEWPRESTNEELAAALDVSSSTFQYHLRAAERAVVESLLE